MTNNYFNFVYADGSKVAATQSFSLALIDYPKISGGNLYPWKSKEYTANVFLDLVDARYKVQCNDIETNDDWFINTSGSNGTGSTCIISGSHSTSSLCSVYFSAKDFDNTIESGSNIEIKPSFKYAGFNDSFVKTNPIEYVTNTNGELTINLIPGAYQICFDDVQRIHSFNILIPASSSISASECVVTSNTTAKVITTKNQTDYSYTAQSSDARYALKGETRTQDSCSWASSSLSANTANSLPANTRLQFGDALLFAEDGLTIGSGPVIIDTDATLMSVNPITADLSGTASYANKALSASISDKALSASVADTLNPYTNTLYIGNADSPDYGKLYLWDGAAGEYHSVEAGDDQIGINASQVVVNGELDVTNGIRGTFYGGITGNVIGNVTGSLNGTASLANDVSFGKAMDYIHLIERFINGTGGAISSRVIFDYTWYWTSYGSTGTQVVNAETMPQAKSWQLTTAATYTSSIEGGLMNPFVAGISPTYKLKWAFKIADATTLNSASVYLGVFDYALNRNTTYKSKLYNFGPNGIMISHRGGIDDNKFRFSYQSNDMNTSASAYSTITADTNWHVFTLIQNNFTSSFQLDNETPIILTGSTNTNAGSPTGPEFLVITSGSYAASVKVAHCEMLIETSGSWY